MQYSSRSQSGVTYGLVMQSQSCVTIPLLLTRSTPNRSVAQQSIPFKFQLLFLTAALYDIEVSSTWLSSKDNWIADALSLFEIKKIADIFPQFQSNDSSFHL